MARYLIIAASSGIGAATCELLRAAGHEVVTTAREAGNGDPDIVLDATDFEAVEQAVVDAGPLDGVACFAGSMLLKPAHLTSRAQYDGIVAASLTTAFATVRAAGRQLRSGGAVVLVSSAAAMAGLPNHDAISAAKAGVIGLMLSSAASYASQGLRINAVAPGLTRTTLTSALTASEGSRKVSESMHALGRLGEPDDVARGVQFLLDPANDWITGQVLGIDGGLGTLRPKVRA
ncbi:NAD(P)-dependent dehydrogenase (short-subunit alcohol dehydrogenase family) [Microbacterium sp. AG1240]|uniref:SDR family NAD(P)-dependent oxidoreductase n=1 Tax=Microbacterium sp. AG1240 TaxID=2183992 RepID=UPI000EAD048F|nr:SDR family oxidoreductase [Microbacterium sp. AG1240]RKT36402.1 NAD(P)-dependent dehydrogenase (short-subunit alcohol dehydrogenase family) [Microbacterium sp. AG1240]